MLFCAGARIEHLACAVLALLPPDRARRRVSAYKRARILAFLDPWKDPQNTGFHIVQSLLALGSGGIFGVGLGASRQKFFYLPEAHTDFIFSPCSARSSGCSAR
jgi:cell division protein FtsW